jgi:Ca-activated chloride channel family protein
LIGYENRVLRREDFNNDKIDAGEIGAGHDVTALYEITLVGSAATQNDPLRYGSTTGVGNKITAQELAFLRLRYKAPQSDTSTLIERPLQRSQIAAQASGRLAFAASVAAFADQLRGGKHVGDFDLARVATLARSVGGQDRGGYRKGFVELVERARSLQTSDAPRELTISQ